MTVQLSTKERLLAQDEQAHEELCVQKYQKYSGQAQDPQLKQLFAQLAQKEQEHLNTINQILSGQIPNVQSGQQGTQAQGQQGMQAQGQQGQQQTINKNDEMLCTDMLNTEKYISDTYNTAIFEFTNTDLRNVLNHIQKEEQEHADSIFKYMQSKGMYQAQ